MLTTRIVLIVLALSAMTSCRAVPQEDAEAVVSSAAETLATVAEQQAAVNPELAAKAAAGAAVLGSIQASDYRGADGQVDLIRLLNAVVTATSSDTETQTLVTASLAEAARRRALEQGMTQAEAAQAAGLWSVSLVSLTLVLRKLLPWLTVRLGSSAVGGPLIGVGKILLDMFFSASSLARAKATMPPSAPAPPTGVAP